MTEEKKDLIVMKFGGSCLQDANSFKQTANIVRTYAKHSKLIIVTSALKGITDKLVNFYKNSCEEAPECDLIIETIFYIHRNLVEEIIEDNTPEYRNTMDFLDEIIDELSQLGRIVRLLRPSMDIQDIIVSYG
ncbi:MAG: amino acid kinase family protein, partial [Promethearchaeota archaeon]